MVDNSVNIDVNVEHHCQEDNLKQSIIEKESEIEKLKKEIEQLESENKEKLRALRISRNRIKNDAERLRELNFLKRKNLAKLNALRKSQ